MEKRNRSPKRVRINSQDSPQHETNTSSPEKQQQQHKSRRSPTKAAEEALERAVESLPASLHKIILHYGKKIINIRSKLHNKKQIESAMASDENYIPKSARASDFKITLPKAAMENTERIEFLQNMVDQAKKTYEGTLKGVVQECITLEIDALVKQEKETIADMLYNLATATMTMLGTTCDPHLRVNNLIETTPSLFQYAPKTSPSSIRGQYSRYHSIDGLPQPTIISINREYGSPTEIINSQNAAAAAAQLPENIGLRMFQSAVEAILVTPTRHFLEQYKKMQCEIALKKLSTEIVDGKTTEDTTMELDAEGAASHELLRDLIRKETEKQNKKYDDLQQKYENLQKEIKRTQKNGNQRGQQQSGASQNKKKSANKSGKDRTQSNQNSRNRNRSRSRTRSRSRGNSNSKKQTTSRRNQGKASDDDSDKEKSRKHKNNRGSGRRSRSRKRTSSTGSNRQNRA